MSITVDDIRRAAKKPAWQAAGFAFLIVLGSSIPGDQIKPLEFRYADKIAHLIEYTIFGILLFRAYRGIPRIVLPGVAVLLTGVAFGALDELHQYFVPGRFPSASDAAADALGLMLAVNICRRWLGDKRVDDPSEGEARKG